MLKRFNPTFITIWTHLINNNLDSGGILLISQTFYKPEDQKYGKEVVATVEDMLRLIDIPPTEMLETNRLRNYNGIFLFKK